MPKLNKQIALHIQLQKLSLDDSHVAKTATPPTHHHYPEVDTPQELATLHQHMKRTPLVRVLSLGEADYSFSWALKQAQPYAAMLATRYESTATQDSKYHKLAPNIDNLKKSGVSRLKGVDATQLDNYDRVTDFLNTHPMNSTDGFEKIYFNFPYPAEGYNGDYAGTIRKIQTMLKDFIQAATPLLAPHGQILIGGFHDKMAYYQPLELVKGTGLTCRSVSWDSHGWLQKYGYEHRRSSGDIELKQPTKDNATLIRLQQTAFNKETLMHLTDMTKKQAKQILTLCQDNNYLDSKGQINEAVVSLGIKTGKIFTDFSPFGLRLQSSVIALLNKIDRFKIETHLNTAIDKSYSYESSRDHYRAHIQPFLHIFSSSQLLRYVKEAYTNSQIATGVLWDRPGYKTELITELNNRSLALTIVKTPDFRPHLRALIEAGLTIDLPTQKAIIRSGDIALVETMLKTVPDLDSTALQTIAKEANHLEIKGLIRGYFLAKKATTT